MISASLDGSLKQWDFYQGVLLKTVSVASPKHLVYNRMNDLVGVSTSSLEVKVFSNASGATNSLQKLKLVRSFERAASNKITDLSFSHDGKWILCSSLDSSIRVWDLLTGQLIDWISFKNAPISIDLSPSGEFMATSHLGQKGVFLWSSKSFFQGVMIEKVPKEPYEIEMPELNDDQNVNSVKQSHKDFYTKKAIQAFDQEASNKF